MTTSLVSPAMVGRGVELRVLEAALDRAVAGSRETVLVAGEAGVGKSRLVGELVARAGATGAIGLRGSCIQLEGGGIPFGPLVEMLRALAGASEGGELASVLGPARAELGRLVPEFADPDLEGEAAAREASQTLELFRDVIARLAAHRTLLLVFEDVQWADPSTIDLIALLAGGAGVPRLMLVLTFRSEELGRTHPFRRSAARWEEQRAATRMELERLGLREVAAQVEAILGERPDGDLVEFVAERSEGIPLFVEELVGAVRERGVERDFLPPSLRDLLLARSERLSPAARQVARVVSAAARPVPDGLLAVVSGLPVDELSAALREAVDQQMLVVDPAGQGFGFRHALARVAIHDDLLPGERVRLHRAYAEALEADPGLLGSSVDVASVLAHHWRAAHDLPRAMAASIEAGNAAAAAAGPAAAQRHLELALELWPQVPDAEAVTGIDHARLLTETAGATFQAGAGRRALGLIDQALAEVGEDSPAERRALLLGQRAEILLGHEGERQAVAVLEGAAGLLPADPPSAARAHILVMLARSLCRIDEYGRAGSLAAEARDAAEAVGATEDRLDAEITLSQALVHGGDVERGLELSRRAAESARAAGMRWIAARAYIVRSDLMLMLGCCARGERDHHRSGSWREPAPPSCVATRPRRSCCFHARKPSCSAATLPSPPARWGRRAGISVASRGRNGSCRWRQWKPNWRARQGTSSAPASSWRRDWPEGMERTSTATAHRFCGSARGSRRRRRSPPATTVPSPRPRRHGGSRRSSHRRPAGRPRRPPGGPTWRSRAGRPRVSPGSGSARRGGRRPRPAGRRRSPYCSPTR
jgi:hypothetical protein